MKLSTLILSSVLTLFSASSSAVIMKNLEENLVFPVEQNQIISTCNVIAENSLSLAISSDRSNSKYVMTLKTVCMESFLAHSVFSLGIGFALHSESLPMFCHDVQDTFLNKTTPNLRAHYSDTIYEQCINEIMTNYTASIHGFKPNSFDKLKENSDISLLPQVKTLPSGTYKVNKDIVQKTEQ